MSLEEGGPHGTPEKAVETPLGLHFENHGLIPYMISLSTIQTTRWYQLFKAEHLPTT